MQADYCTCSRAEGLALRSLPTARRCAGPDTCFNGGAASLVPPPLGHYLFVKGGGMAYPTKAGAGIGGWDTVVKGGTQVYKTPPFSGKYQARLLRRLRVSPRFLPYTCAARAHRPGYQRFSISGWPGATRHSRCMWS